MASQPVAIAEAEALELAPIRMDELWEVAAQLVEVDEAGFDLADRVEQGVREPRHGRGAVQIVQRRRRDHTPEGQHALGIRGDIRSIATAFADVAEEIVERPDGAGEERGGSPNQVTLDAIDVDAVRDDEPRVALEHVDVALQEQRDLAGVSRPHDERETHRSIVVLAPGALSYAFVRLCAKSAESAPGLARRDAARPDPGSALLGDRLGPAPAPCDRLPWHSRCAVVAQIRLLGSAPCIGVIQPHHGTTTLRYLLAAVVAHEDRLSCHQFLLRLVFE